MGSTKLGKYIQLSERKNNDSLFGLENVKGISIQKCFIDTKADMGGVSLKPYLLVPPDYFAYVPITSRNGEKITIAYNGTNDTYICSSSYIVFNVICPEEVCSGYLFMYFNRPEFDRYARFNSWGSAHEAFSWSDMCDIEINLPSLAIQRKYADAYVAILSNENYRLRLGNVAPILIKGSLEEASE